MIRPDPLRSTYNDNPKDASPEKERPYPLLKNSAVGTEGKPEGDPGPRPPWWPEGWPWPYPPDEPVAIEVPQPLPNII